MGCIRPLLLVLCFILYVSTHGTPAEYVCKHDEIVEEMGEPEIVPQRYETFIHPRSIGKRDASSYQPIRVVFNETFLLNDADSRQCTVVGQDYQRGNPADNTVRCSSGNGYNNCWGTCVDEMIVNSTFRTDLLAFMGGISAKISSLLNVQQVVGGLVFPTSGNCGSKGGVPTSPSSYPNGDIVLYLTARPSPIGSSDTTQIAFAAACLTDNRGRAIAGQVNVNPANYYGLDATVKFAVLLHEVTHALGFSKSAFPRYLDEQGNTRTNVLATQSRTFGGITLNATFLATPSVVTAARAQFNCSTLLGGELEDQGGSGTAGSHWKMRVFLGEYMIGTAQFPNPVKAPSISALTLAALHDSGWYLANFDKAEFLEWGYNQGCSFAQDRCESWTYSTGSYTSGYFCNTASQKDCSFNHVYSGYCSIQTSGTPLTYYQHFPGDNTKYNQNAYMDYCPIVWGYSNGDCRQSKNTPTPAQYASDASVNYGDPDSRCFKASLLKSTSGYSPNAVDTRCYKRFCVGGKVIVNIGGTNYTCPVGGGDMTGTIAGYKGSFICPHYNAICANEPIDATTTASPTTTSVPTTTATPSTVPPTTTQTPTTTIVPTTTAPTTTQTPTTVQSTAPPTTSVPTTTPTPTTVTPTPAQTTTTSNPSTTTIPTSLTPTPIATTTTTTPTTSTPSSTSSVPTTSSISPSMTPTASPSTTTSIITTAIPTMSTTSAPSTSSPTSTAITTDTPTLSATTTSSPSSTVTMSTNTPTSSTITVTPTVSMLTTTTIPSTTATPTPSSSITDTPTPTFTSPTSSTLSSSPTVPNTGSSTATPTTTVSATDTPTPTATPTSSNSITATPTIMSSSTDTPTASPTVSNTPSLVPTSSTPTTSTVTTTATTTTPTPTTIAPNNTPTVTPTSTVVPTTSTTSIPTQTTVTLSPTPTSIIPLLIGINTLQAGHADTITITGTNLLTVQSCRFTYDPNYNFKKQEFSSTVTRETSPAACTSIQCTCTVPLFTIAQNQLLFVELVTPTTTIKLSSGDIITFMYVDQELLSTKYDLVTVQSVLEQFSTPPNQISFANAFDNTHLQVNNVTNQLEITSTLDTTLRSRYAMYGTNLSSMVNKALTVQFRTTVSDPNTYGHIIEASLFSNTNNYRYLVTASLEQSERYLYIIFNSTEEYSTHRVKCMYNDRTLYRLQLEIASPTKAGIGYRVRARLTSTSSAFTCEATYKPYSFREKTFLSSLFLVGISQSNIDIVNIGTRKRQSATTTMAIELSDVSVGCVSSTCTTTTNTLITLIVFASLVGAAIILSVFILVLSVAVYCKCFRSLNIQVYRKHLKKTF